MLAYKNLELQRNLICNQLLDVHQLITSRSKSLKRFVASTFATPYNEIADLDNKHSNMMGEWEDTKAKITSFC
jgi:hypothetical protein